MVEYDCDGCQKKFNHKSTYDRHRNKKKPCKINDNNQKNDEVEVQNIIQLDPILENINEIPNINKGYVSNNISYYPMLPLRNPHEIPQINKEYIPNSTQYYPIPLRNPHEIPYINKEYIPNNIGYYQIPPLCNPHEIPYINKEHIPNIMSNLQTSQIVPNIANVEIKPIDNIKSHKCNYCDNCYTQACHLLRHMKSCLEKKQSDQKYETEINNLKQKYELLNKDIESKNKEIDGKNKELSNKDTEIAYLKTLVDGAGGIIKTSMNATSYIMANYTNAPLLLAITDKSIITKNKDNFVDELIYSYNNNILDRHIGDIVVSHYKKTDPKTQPLWNTDVPRLNYMVRTPINDKEDWFIDKKGNQLKAKVIDPLLNDHIKPDLLKYLVDQNNKINTVKDIEHLDNLFDSMKIVNLIIKLIDESKLADDIIRYVASHFFFQRKDDVKMIEHKEVIV